MISTHDCFLFEDKLTRKKIKWRRIHFDNVKKDHPEIRDHFHLLVKAVEKPDIINQDADYPDRRIHYLLNCHTRNNALCNMKVVIARSTFGRLTVITAYFKEGIKSSETLIWKK